MGSASISHLIIFIASLLVAASVAGTLIVGVEQVSDSVDQQSEDMTQQIDTEIRVISDPASNAIYNGDSEDGEDNSSTLTLLVKNTGQNTLQTESSSLDVLLDGQYQPDPEIEVVSGGERWSSGAVAEVTVTLDEDLESGDHRVTVIVNGNRTTFEFYHE
jgi:flagellar protein FlaG